MTGTVKTGSGEAVTNASVFIYTAGPRLGPGYLCPSCYADCRKSTRSDAAGAYTIESLDPKLLFRVLVVAPGYAPAFFDKVDPVKRPLVAKLKPRSTTNLPPERVLLGRVVDSHKQPVAYATVSPYGVASGNSTTYGSVEGVDPLAVTDDQGNFSLSFPNAYDGISVQVEARGFARGRFRELTPGPNRHVLVVTEGASLVGRVLHHGQPLKDVSVGVVSTDRGADNFIGHFEVATTADGKFLFVNLAPDHNYDLYASMSSLKGAGALPARKIRVKGDGSLANAGELSLVPGYRLAGEVRLADGKPIPAHTRLAIEPGGTWDAYAIVLPPDGRFDVPNVPTGELTVWVTLNGYRHAARNFSLDHFNPHLVGRLEADQTNLTILLEAGERPRPDYTEQIPEEERANNLPIAGIERSRSNSHPWVITGRVVDAETKAPLPAFRISPGGKGSRDTPFTQWFPSRGTTHSNGNFRVELSRKAGLVVLQAEAEGYLPAVSETMELYQKTADFELRKGAGPSGVLLSPDGKPAAGVTVIYLGPQEQAQLDNQGKLAVSSVVSPEASQTLTDPEGRFSFPPKVGDGHVLAANEAGFARSSAKGLAAKGKLTLRPWASVDGQLVQHGKPVAGEHLDLEWPGNTISDGPIVHLPGTRTDDAGRFAIKHIPAGQLQIVTRVPDKNSGGWGTQPQLKFMALGGTNVSLGEIRKAEDK